jgi:hypothetical protein
MTQLLIGCGLGAAWVLLLAWLNRRRPAVHRRRECFHHEHGGNPANTEPAHSWIKQELIDMGRNKMFWCDREQGGCGQTWFAW